MSIVNGSSLEALKKNIAEIDTRLASLHPRLTGLRAEVEKLIEKENRHIRLFAEADAKEKKKIDHLIVDVVERRASLEKECKGVSIAIAELEQRRNELAPQYQELLNEEQNRARKERIEALRKQHEADKAAEHAADQALLRAREKSNRSFFNWRSALDQLAVEEQAAALAKQKEIWAARSGPHAANQRSAS